MRMEGGCTLKEKMREEFDSERKTGRKSRYKAQRKIKQEEKRGVDNEAGDSDSNEKEI